ncbi:MAG: M48 family metalloprotease [Deltaproteobacteria bacterium]|nr:M48 family metalloprotease [Deltaproteobacteria bacterium]
MRISTSGPSFHSVPQRASAKQTARAQEGSAIETMLFGSVRPKVLDAAHFPQLAEQIRWLNRQKMRIASFVGDKDEEYEIVLAEGMNACIDPHGKIYIGERLISLSDQALLAGVLAHEIGHRPKTWKKLRQGHGLSREQLLAFARDEEAKADRVAGRSLAALELDPQRLCTFLKRTGNFEKQPETYYPADVRVAMIIEAYEAQRTRKDAAKSLFPGYQRATDIKNIVDESKKPPPTPRRSRRLGKTA